MPTPDAIRTTGTEPRAHRPRTTPGRFRAVVTTGIYCREGCPASPNPEHVVGYEFAAAAEAAGFRPCHRCRPYRSSEPTAWVGTSELVCRAVRLILDGALDEGTEDGLAARLGVSGRHLRRLFAEQVGATPDVIARSRRAHFARRLLDETDLSVADVCFASGFGSVRQMHRTMRAVFRASPSELRAKRRSADRLVADGGLDLRLPFRPPLAWTELLAFLAPRAAPGVEAVSDDVYRRTITVDGFPGVVEIRPGGDDHLLLRAHLPRWEGLIHVVERVRRMFDLDCDPGEVDHALADDPVVGPRRRAVPGLRVPGAWDGFELAVRAILGQQVSVAGATTLAGRLVRRAGREVPGLTAMGLSRTFPDPEALAVADLDGLGITKRREATIRAVAEAVLAGGLPLDGSADLEDTTSALCAIPGIGPWTAQYVAMRAGGDRDAFPASDLGLRRAAGGGSLVSEAELVTMADRWRPWRSYAALALWTTPLPRS